MAVKRNAKEIRRIGYYSIRGAAKVAGLTDGAIRHAIARGDLVAVETACGRTRLVDGRSLRAFVERPRKRGRPGGSRNRAEGGG